MRQVVLIILLSLLVFPALGQVKVSGVVRGKNSELLIGANVILKNTYLGVSTDIKGEFSFPNVLKGEHTIMISYIGYETYYKDIIVNNSVHFEFQLVESSILADEVIVTATRATSDMPMAYVNISKEEIEKRNLGQDIPYLLNQSPSFVVTSDAGAGIGYTSFRIRGTDITRINVTVNGIPFNDAESHGTWWVDLPDFASSVDNVQIQRGVGTSTNGAGAFGATVNFQTFELKRNPYAVLSSSFGSFNTFKNSIKLGSGLINGKFSFDARFSKIKSDGYIDRAFSDLGSFNLSGGYYGKKDILKAVLISGKEKTYQAWDGVPSWALDTNRTYNGIGKYTDSYGNTKYYENETDNYWQDHFQVFYTRELIHQLLLNLAFHYTHGKGFYEQYKVSKKFSDYGLEDIVIGSDTISRSDLIQQKWLDNDFYGFTYSINYKKKKCEINVGGAWNRYIGDHFGKIVWIQLAPKGGYDHEWYYNEGVKTDFNLFGKLNYRLNSSLNLFGDLQIRKILYNIEGIDDDLRNITQTHKFLFFNPKFGINYRISVKHKAFLSFSVANREPNRSNFIDADPSGPLPASETLRDYEVGYNYNTSITSLGLNLYFMDYKDQLVLTGEINDVGSPVMTNVKRSYRAGIEIIAGIRFTSKLKWEVNATISKNKIKDFTEYVDDWDTWSQRITHLGTTDLAFSPEIIAGSHLSYKVLDGLNIGLISKYVGNQYIDNTSNSNRTLNDYFVNDLVIGFSLKTKNIKEISFNLLVNNLFNIQYESNAWIYRYYHEGIENFFDGYFPQSGTNFLLGVQLKF